MRTALFAGSFDPFTIGHKDIADRSLQLFDRLVIAIGVNQAKKGWMPADERVRSIAKLYADNTRVEVTQFSDLTVRFARQIGARWLVRGVRTSADFEFERNLADANLLIDPEIETILLPARPDLAVVSSSLVRELAAFGAPYEQFLP